jgi:hypothetical protein
MKFILLTRLGSILVNMLIAKIAMYEALKIHEHPLHSLKVGLSCGVSCRHVIGSPFFSEMPIAEHYQQLIR